MNILPLLIITNGLVFLFMWKDKQASRNRGWRIPENVLLLLTLLGGTPAMLLARQVFRHKTKKSSFVWRLYAIMLVQVLAFIYFSRHGLVS